jgi:hypothetical protein
VAKKNRKRNKAIAATLAAQKAAEEQQLPPPPEVVTPLDAVGQATEGVREQQLGMWAQDTFSREAEVEKKEAQLQAQLEAFEAEQKRYDRAYARRGADSDEDRGGVLAGERTLRLALMAGLAFAAIKVLA